MSQSFTLTLPSDIRMLSVARSFLEAVCSAGGLDRSTTHAIVMATGEAVCNVIRHAHTHQPDAPIQVECRLESQSIEICLRDRGSPFNLADVPEMDPGELRVGGRGVYMMRKLMDEVSCEPIVGEGNVLRMVKRWTPGDSTRDVG